MSTSEQFKSVLDEARDRIALIKLAPTAVQADEVAAQARCYIASLREQNLIQLLILVTLLTEADQALRDRGVT